MLAEKKSTDISDPHLPIDTAANLPHTPFAICAETRLGELATVSAGLAPLKGLWLTRASQRTQHDQKEGRDKGLALRDRQTGQLKLSTRPTQTTSENDWYS